VTSAAQAWQGWGTALKAALEPIVLEPIVVARKPLDGTVAANVQKHGTGAVNIDGCRLAGEASPSIERRKGATNHLSTRPAAEAEADGRIESRTTPERYREPRAGEALGRWPANLIHDGSDEVVSLFPEEAGAFAPVRGSEPSRPAKNTYGEFTRGGGYSMVIAGAPRASSTLRRRTRPSATARSIRPSSHSRSSGTWCGSSRRSEGW
jgi:site-specific DNA-methyltransferase (adenine-specific)